MRLENSERDAIRRASALSEQAERQRLAMKKPESLFDNQQPTMESLAKEDRLNRIEAKLDWLMEQVKVHGETLQTIYNRADHV